MNYLAHAYLSFNEPDILAGNMISDFVKGKTKYTFSPGIQAGIALHRLIDEFTDNHPATKAAKIFFKPAYRLYAGAFIDVVYDHFLATDTNEFVLSTSLENFTKNVYRLLRLNISQLPPQFQKLFPYMETQNWLCNYQYKAGIEKSFWGLVKRAAYLQEHNTAFMVFTNHYEELGFYYRQFFPDLKKYAEQQFNMFSETGPPGPLS